MTVVYPPRVQQDVFDAMDFYNERSNVAGDRFFEEFEQAIVRIKDATTILRHHKRHLLFGFRRKW